VSDRMPNRLFSGNPEERWETRERTSLGIPKRRLVEECEVVSVSAVQRACGKRPLIAAIRQARPFQIQIPGGYFDLWLVDEPHRLPGSYERWSSREAGNARLWMICPGPGCHRNVRKLYYFYLDPSTLLRSDLLCRECHGLVYQSTNCGSNRWYQRIARPMKRLLSEKGRLLEKSQSSRIVARLARIETEMQALRRMLNRRPRSERGSSLRRPYRDLSLLS
jgi:hypothetical protein